MKRQELAKKKFFDGDRAFSHGDQILPTELLKAQNTLAELANFFFRANTAEDNAFPAIASDTPSLTDVCRILVEQIPAIVFIGFFDKSFGEAYVSPQIEETLGFTQEEWLNDPIRWYDHIHPDDKDRWSSEVAQMLLTGDPLSSEYSVISRSGQTVRFHCEVKIVRNASGHPWFIHGTAFDITRQHEDETALREYAARMKVLSQSLLDVQEVERRRIALELHDQIGQILTGLKLKLEMLARSANEGSDKGFDEAQQLVNDLISRTRELSLDLRPATLDHLGLLAALLRHLRNYSSRTGVHVVFHHIGLEARRFDPELETAAFRIVQEALTNIARHSGTNEASVNISADKSNLNIEIVDSGRGFDTKKTLAAGLTNGLTGMRERASLSGGSFAVDSGAGGTRLTASWNIEKQSTSAGGDED